MNEFSMNSTCNNIDTFINVIHPHNLVNSEFRLILLYFLRIPEQGSGQTGGGVASRGRRTPVRMGGPRHGIQPNSESLPLDPIFQMREDLLLNLPINICSQESI